MASGFLAANDVSSDEKVPCPFSGIDSHQAASHTLNPVHPNVTRCGSVSQLLFLPPAAKAAPVT